mmetsp:Transcript_5730/g.11205  ORF Transcript_5730/g.11205 Transcript_5730/m.11205 type:complete len:162 (+) Transcript_5730:130-615(+)
MSSQKRVWRRLLPALVVICPILYNMISQGIVTNPIIDKSSINNSNKTQEITTKKLPPIKGKIPTCTTPQNNCVKPFYKPEVVECLVRQRQKIDSSGAWRLPDNFMYKFDQNFADAVLDRVISGSVLELGAGLGCYTTYFHDSGKLSSIAGYEGAVNVESMS